MRTIVGYVFLTALSIACLIVGANMPGRVPAEPNVEWLVCDPYVEVHQAGGIGSGVYVGGHRVLTAKHVVEAEGPITLLRVSPLGGMKTTWKAQVLRHDPVHDLSLLYIEEYAGLVAAGLDPSLTLKTGEPCWYVGSPYGYHRSLESSLINQPVRLIDGFPFATVNGNANRGNSGGPLYVRRGNTYVLAGICSRFVFIHPFALPPVASPIAYIGPAEMYAFLESDK